MRSENLAFSHLNMTEINWVSAKSTFEKKYEHDGLLMNSVFKLPTVGLSMDDAVDRLNTPLPDYIKMDVDGIEHLILKGGINTLKATKCALIEINDKFIEQANDATKYLENAGSTLKEKRHADYLDHIQSAARHTYNKIWVK